MKKFALIFSSLLMLFILVGCGNNNSNNSAKSSNSSVKSSASDSSSTNDSDSDSTENTNYIDQNNSSLNKNDYKNGITYDNLARTPDKFTDKKVSFDGSVIQAVDEDNEYQLRLAVDGDSDNIALITIKKKNLNGSRILENDLITVYGKFDGIAKYKSTMGQPIAIPSIETLKIDDKGTAPDDYGV